MKKRPDTLETVHLTLELLRRIPRGRKITAAELHEQLNGAGIVRDLRTIQRQLEMLIQHYEIECDDQSKPYGYRWMQHSKGMALPILSEQESLLLMLAEQYLKNILPANLMKSMDGFFVQARANLDPYGSAKREREWLAKVRVVSATQPLLPPKIKSGVFEAVSNALYSNYWLNIDYTNISGSRLRAKVMPLGLAQQGVALYLVCRYEGFDDDRNLALHRMESAEISTLTFDRPKDFSLQKYDQDGHFGFGDGKLIKLKFQIEKTSGVHLLEMRLSEDQTVKEVGDYYEISATVVESERLDWWLLGFGNRVKNIQRQLIKTKK